MPMTISGEGQAPDPKYVAVVTALTRALLDTADSTSLPHGVLLDGLLSAYGSRLLKHPCCWEGSAPALRLFADQLDAMRLAQAAAADQAAQDAIAAAMRPAA